MYFAYNAFNILLLFEYEDFDKAIELNPNYIEARKYKTYIYERLGEYEKIISEYEKIIEIEPAIENYDFYLRYLV